MFHALGVLNRFLTRVEREREREREREGGREGERAAGIVHHCVSLCVAEPGDLAVATHCSPLANNERSNSSNGSNGSTNASGTAASKSYSLEHRIQRVSTLDRRHLAAQRSYRGLFGCRGSVFAAAECVDQKIGDSVPRAVACPLRIVVDTVAR